MLFAILESPIRTEKGGYIAPIVEMPPKRPAKGKAAAAAAKKPKVDPRDSKLVAEKLREVDKKKAVGQRKIKVDSQNLQA